MSKYTELIKEFVELKKANPKLEILEFTTNKKMCNMQNSRGNG